ncbi:MAG: ABC transporter permease [Candidatus Sumerlaeia bacterium]|nr:ABC transporter permease [Candidatus Sumerlaeia bacterium]
MNLLLLAWRYLWHRPLVSFLTLSGIVLGVALICSVLTIRRETERAFLEEAGLIDLVVGAKGSPLQLVLSSVYHLDIPTGNISQETYREIATDPRVHRVYPLALGDNYRGHRIVGTTPTFQEFSRRDRESGGWKPLIAMLAGRFFQADFEAVLGHEVARASGLGIGDTFVGTHGLVAVPGAELHDDFPYEVVGIMAPTGTSLDRAIYTTIESVWKVHEKEEELHRRLYGGGRNPATAADEGDDEDEEGGGVPWLAMPTVQDRATNDVTALLVQLELPGLRLWMVDEINRKTEAMGAVPINEVLRLWQRVLRPMERALLAVAWLVVVVASLGIVATLVQSAERHRRDWAILRSLGARRWEIFSLVLLESVLLTVLGILLGWGLGRGAIAVAGGHLRAATGFSVNPWVLDPVEFLALGTVFAVGILAGLIPALLAYRRRPAEDLSS